MVFLFTDFGYSGPYVGQMKAALYERLPEGTVIDLMHDAPRFNSKASAYLLAALAEFMPANAVTAAVIDPGVGSKRKAIALKADSRWFVGPDNGLLALVARRAKSAEIYDIAHVPSHLSASFHGRDLFAPVCAELAQGILKSLSPRKQQDRIPGSDWPEDCAEIIYIDEFGNAMTGMRFDLLPTTCDIRVDSQLVPVRRTFSDAPVGVPLAYRNSQGLLEIAVNQGSATADLALEIGSRIDIVAQT
ncbi:SAM hydrolase/SAM-dependent halogenase family protein [Aestuariispira ectoiniformans]|uniref:SAM hydrolase/SAM-dependent halogenase family protein n=1 Tax=Aestuariispira ectoiniformans TaxID=2775080 RepID=UPI00223BECD9|nr:SAM-dependent chlorinase/fluorinase [Aestuariispira ectoiniformans]